MKIKSRRNRQWKWANVISEERVSKRKWEVAFSPFSHISLLAPSCANWEDRLELNVNEKFKQGTTAASTWTLTPTYSFTISILPALRFCRLEQSTTLRKRFHKGRLFFLASSIYETTLCWYVCLPSCLLVQVVWPFVPWLMLCYFMLALALLMTELLGKLERT